METEKKLKLLQLFYAGVLADSIGNYEKFGILPQVVEKKTVEQKIMAKGQLAQLGVNSPAELFEKLYEIFGCIKWKVEDSPGKIIAIGDRCLLSAIAKKMEVVQPCSLYCINPFAALVAEMEPGWNLSVNETLWDCKKCEFELTQFNSMTIL
jgi:hypothetical protein